LSIQQFAGARRQSSFSPFQDTIQSYGDRRSANRQQNHSVSTVGDAQQRSGEAIEKTNVHSKDAEIAIPLTGEN